MGEPKLLYRAGEMLQIGSTIAAIAVALATFYLNKGPKFSGTEVHIIPVLLLFGGFIAMGSCLVAISDLYTELYNEQVRANPTASGSELSYPSVLLFITLSLVVTAGVYFFLLADIAYSA